MSINQVLLIIAVVLFVVYTFLATGWLGFNELRDNLNAAAVLGAGLAVFAASFYPFKH